MSEPKAHYLASVIAGADDDTQSEGAAAELAQKDARIAALAAQIAALEELLAFVQMAIHSAAGNMTAADARIRQYREVTKIEHAS